MVRKLAAALLGVGVLIPGLANALGLGEIKLHSALNEPLNADIELVQVRELSSSEILPSLASNSEFKSADVERTQFLTGLKFEVHVNENGKSYIHVTSRKPVREPFLNFLVEVNWPAGRLLREYTLLLDPPLYSEQRAQEVKTATAGSAQPASQPAAQTSGSAAETPAQPAATAETAAGPSSSSHTITRNDSLWSIAKELKPSDNVTVQQTMLALQRVNPNAFIDNNINLLRRGQVLRAPTEAEAMQVSARDAVALVAEQNRAWREQVTGQKQAAPEARQIDLSGRTAGSTPPPAKAGDEGRLKLLSANAGQSTNGEGGTGNGAGQLRDKLAAAQENADKFKLANEDLKVKMNDLQDQLKTSEKVLTLKDQQIAALQAKLAEMQKQAQEAQAAAEQAKASTAAPAAAQPAEKAATQPGTAAEAPAQTETATTKPAAEETATQQPVDYNYQESSAAKPAQPETSKPETTPTEATPAAEKPAATEEKAKPGVVVEEHPQVEVKQAKPAATPTPAPKPAPVSSPDLMTQIMSNPLYLGVGGGAVVLLLLTGLIAMRRKKSEEDEYDESLVEDFQLPDTSAEESEDEFDASIGDFMEEEAVAEEEPLPREETVPQTSDVLGEADIYIAYGRFPQAIEMLQKAAEKEPDRADIRLKLCEVCADANDAQTFMPHYEVLKQIGSSSDVARADELRARLTPDSGIPVESDDTGFDEEFTEEATSEDLADAESFDFDISDAEPVAAAELEEESDTGLDFDLGDLEDTNATFETPAETTEDSGLDFELGEEDKPVQVEPEALTGEGGLDFDMDFETPTAEAPLAEPATDENALDFDTEFSLDSVESQPVESVQPESGLGEDLSLDFDQMEIESGESATTEQVAGMDFDLDFDIEAPATSAEPGAVAPEPEDETLMFSPSADTGDETVLAPASDELELDSASAAQLADELDFDLDSDLAGNENLAEAAPTLDEPAPAEEASLDDDATLLAPQADFVPPGSAPSQAANDMGDEEELDFLSDSDETSTKLDLARAYIDMGDRDGARDILDEVLIEGNDNQKSEAKELLTRLES